MFKRPTKRSLRLHFRDAPMPMARTREAGTGPAAHSPQGTPNNPQGEPGNFESLTTRTLVGQWPVEGARYVFWPENKNDRYSVWRREVGAMDPPQLIADYPNQDPSSYFSFDQTATHWRLFRTDRVGLNQGQVWNGSAAGMRAAAAVGDNMRRIQNLNAANRQYWNDK